MVKIFVVRMKGVTRVYIAIIMAACLSCNKKEALFTRLSASATNINFANNLEKREGFGILYYLYYYNGGGVSTGDINNDGLADIYFTANSFGNNKLYLNKGNFKFEDITEKAGVAGMADWSSGVTMADVNGDGYLDIYVSVVSQVHDLQGRNQLFLNRGNNTFIESAAAYGLDFAGFSTQAAFFDYDHDGDLDCYLLNQSNRPNENIADTSKRRVANLLTGDRMYRNELTSGLKKFTDVSAQTGIYQSNLGYGLGVAVADLNNDGWDDLYIGNDFHENDYYYINNGNGTFNENGANHFKHYSRFSMGNDAADFNNDGQLDVFTADMLPADEKVLKTYGSDENPDIYRFKLEKNGYQNQYSRNCLQRNNGDGSSFSEVGLIAGVSATDWSWAPLFADFDNDGNKDLVITSGIVKRPVDLDYVRFVSSLAQQQGSGGSQNLDEQALEKMPDGASHPFFFKGDGNLAFADKSAEWGTGDMKGYYNGASYADLDNDGRLDLVFNAINSGAVILKNNTPAKNYISIAFKGAGYNVKGVGAKAYVFANNKLQYQQLMLTRGFQSSVAETLHFGLEKAATIDSILIVWPSQKFQCIKSAKINTKLLVDEAAAGGRFEHRTFFRPVAEILTALPDIKVNWQHKENPFIDFNTQYLIPHQQSTRGPKVAVADVNGDGLEDFYVCGAAGQSGALMVQQLNGQFVQKASEDFEAAKNFEEVDARFFDADGNGTIDLYVASGGNEMSDDDPLLQDHLYLNDGKGNFMPDPNALPGIRKNKSCVTVADIDHDGDVDVFAGVLADARAYGIPQTSYLLINNGKGKFSIAESAIIDLTNIGMVTTAVLSDIDHDGWEDLLIAGEFMPVTIFRNQKGNFKKEEIMGSAGWWQTIFVHDINGDGKPDLLLGNYGHNNKFKSGKDGPVQLYAGDFDNNGQVDQLLSYTIKGEAYPFLAKDEVERSMPLLKKHYLLYADYAGKPMKEVFYGWIDTVKPLLTERLGSAMAINDGKGNFTLNDLPGDLQLAPVFAFNTLPNDHDNTFICGGNFFDVIPYEGRYDAQPLAIFSIKNQTARWLPQRALSQLPLQVRDIKTIANGKYGKLVIVASNNSGLLFYRVRPK